jgi:hypothetical protein
MDTLLATVCLPRWRHERGHRHHAAFPLPSRNCTVSHSPALAPIPERRIEKRAQGGLVGKQLRFLEVVPPRSPVYAGPYQFIIVAMILAASGIAGLIVTLLMRTRAFSTAAQLTLRPGDRARGSTCEKCLEHVI